MHAVDCIMSESAGPDFGEVRRELPALVCEEWEMMSRLRLYGIMRRSWLYTQYSGLAPCLTTGLTCNIRFCNCSLPSTTHDKYRFREFSALNRLQTPSTRAISELNRRGILVALQPSRLQSTPPPTKNTITTIPAQRPPIATLHAPAFWLHALHLRRHDGDAQVSAQKNKLGAPPAHMRMHAACDGTGMCLSVCLFLFCTCISLCCQRDDGQTGGRLAAS
ncbi:hypothetical protein V8C44DRAFT_48130 [Trichoderma aethiopicum]